MDDDAVLLCVRCIPVCTQAQMNTRVQIDPSIAMPRLAWVHLNAEVLRVRDFRTVS